MADEGMLVRCSVWTRQFSRWRITAHAALGCPTCNCRFTLRCSEFVTIPDQRCNAVALHRVRETRAYAAAMNFSASLGSASHGKNVRGSSKPLANAFPTFGLLCAATRMLITCGGGGCSMALVQPVTNCA
jgi:hypothetical protein